jgi:SP family general alpha glucoside:H+ symporter-like MFS transporter
MESFQPQDVIAPAKGQASAQDRRGSPTPMAKVIENAKAATEKEQKMTLLQGIKLYPKAVIWSVVISTCIAMEGYDISLVNNFYAFDQFNRKYGEISTDGSYQVPARVIHLSRHCQVSG